MNIEGLDLSKFDKGIDFNLVKNKGYQFVILRAGYTGYAKSKKQAKDECFEDFYKKAKSLGLHVGAYWFSRAVTKEEGEKEAKYLYEKCLLGKQFEYPIYFDVEDEYYQIKDKKGTTDAIIGFCEWLENKGYYVGYYANPIWLKKYLETERLKPYDLWLAHWVESPSKKWKYGIWQDGGIRLYDGDKKRDHNIAFTDYPSIIIKKGFNGFTKQEETKEEIKEEEKGENEDETKPTLKIGDEVKIIGLGNTSPYGKGKTTSEQTIGWVRYIVRIVEGCYPYLVANISNGKIKYTGYYTAEALEKI